MGMCIEINNRVHKGILGKKNVPVMRTCMNLKGQRSRDFKTQPEIISCCHIWNGSPFGI